MEIGNFAKADEITRAEWPVAALRTDHIAGWVAVVIGDDALLAWWTKPLRHQTSCWPGADVRHPPNWSEFDLTWTG